MTISSECSSYFSELGALGLKVASKRVLDGCKRMISSITSSISCNYSVSL